MWEYVDVCKGRTLQRSLKESAPRVLEPLKLPSDERTFRTPEMSQKRL